MKIFYMEVKAIDNVIQKFNVFCGIVKFVMA